jgi:hypothetical protein
MAYNVLQLLNDRMAILCTPHGPVIHIEEKDGVFTVAEDEQRRSFATFGRALDCAREIGRDPDLPSARQV